VIVAVQVSNLMRHLGDCAESCGHSGALLDGMLAVERMAMLVSVL
jgi:hypothetical protein